MRLSQPPTAILLSLGLVTAAAALAAAPASEDIPGSQFTSGNWSGGAWADDSGAFVDCYVGVGYNEGAQLSLSLTADDTLTVYLSAPGASFTPGQSYDAALMTEVGLPAVGPAFGSNEAYVGFALAGIDASIDFLTQGSYLRLYGIGIDQAFDVRGMGGALAQARMCLEAQTGPAQTVATSPAQPEKPALGRPAGTKPAQLSGQTAVFKRQHMPCKDDTCK
ncbi:hypothetical protein LHP98_08730 [Rhodobacter sp. Har01]|uniref:hypothetical protein n=1 Tax=Rhodobacter sp. Har01 TaxID=2883999 RepID=UPI001D0604FA|nr:hypothetical protein [Rhodobacter sp. Har01]MCB6178213.1 hypothetical protein [Rhodobacter sp. Har01]